MNLNVRRIIVGGAPSYTKIADGIARNATHVQGDLEFSTEYEWYVVAKALGQSVTGPTWSFTTIAVE